MKVRLIGVLTVAAAALMLLLSPASMADEAGLSGAKSLRAAEARLGKPLANGPEKLTAAERQELDAWLGAAEGKPRVMIDLRNPGDLRELDLLRRQAGYPKISDYLARLKSSRSNDDPACAAFLEKYDSNGLFLDVGVTDDGKDLTATTLQANALIGLPPVDFDSMVVVSDAAGEHVTSGTNHGRNAPLLVTRAPPKPGSLAGAKPARAAAVFTVFKSDGTPCAYRVVSGITVAPTAMAVTAPTNKRPNSGTVLCLNRASPDKNWPNACDFGPFSQSKDVGGHWTVVVPVAGSITLPGKVVMDGNQPAGDLRVTAINTKNGITCAGQTPVDVGKKVLAVSRVTGDDTIAWSMTAQGTGADAAPSFGSTCYEQHTGVAFNMAWNLSYLDDKNIPRPVIAIISNVLTQGSFNTLIVPAVDLQFGCLPAGTLIGMADGGTRRIEDIVRGDQVIGTDGRPWTVSSRMDGEDTALVEIEAEDGTRLRASPGHPVIVGHDAKGRLRAVAASDLKVGMPLTTRLGASRVAKAVTVAWEGTVHNLAIRPADAAGDDVAASRGGAFWADGLLVGDQTMQGLLPSAQARADTTDGQRH